MASESATTITTGNVPGRTMPLGAKMPKGPNMLTTAMFMYRRRWLVVMLNIHELHINKHGTWSQTSCDNNYLANETMIYNLW